MTAAYLPMPIEILVLSGEAATEDLTTDTHGASSLRAELVSSRFIELIPRDFARQHLVVSQGSNSGGPYDGECVDTNGRPPVVEVLAVAESTSPAAVHNVGVRLGALVETSVHDGEAIARVVDEVYGRADETVGNAQLGDFNPDELSRAHIGGVERLLAQADRDLLSTQGKAPVIKLVDGLLFEALGRKASDVHIQPLADRTQVRYRVDGVLHTVGELPQTLTNPVISRIKVMGRMDIAERRVPQDGRATVMIGNAQVGGRSIDLRISTLPTSYGERAVIRLLDNTNHLCDFHLLGMPDDVAQKYLERARRANGMILLTGPTGSGKTTTLYSTLRQIGSSEVNILTIEDPIEYELSAPEIGLAISQSQVNLKKGVTFVSGLRHILRQDPDVVMVGEIRDAETARIAVQSSLTGHLVFSTLHTNDAASAITRLLDLGIEPYLVSASLSAVLAQRLVRKFHEPCGGAGCQECLRTGFAGRTGLFELLVVDETIRELVASEAALGQIREAAHAAGMRSLRDEGQRLVDAGLTGRAEVDRVVHGAF